MAGRNGQELLTTWVPAELAASFRALARESDGGTAAALRRLVANATQDRLGNSVNDRAELDQRGVGRGEQVGVRLKAAERAALAEAARAQGTSPANWIRSLALVHLTRRPQWNPAELDALRDVFHELRALAQRLEHTGQEGSPAPGDGAGATQCGSQAALEAAQLVRSEMRRVVGIMTGNFSYWGLPGEDRPQPSPGAVKQAGLEVQAAQARRSLRPRRRSARFAAGD